MWQSTDLFDCIESACLTTPNVQTDDAERFLDAAISTYEAQHFPRTLADVYQQSPATHHAEKNEAKAVVGEKLRVLESLAYSVQRWQLGINPRRLAGVSEAMCVGVFDVDESTVNCADVAVHRKFAFQLITAALRCHVERKFAIVLHVLCNRFDSSYVEWFAKRSSTPPTTTTSSPPTPPMPVNLTVVRKREEAFVGTLLSELLQTIGQRCMRGEAYRRMIVSLNLIDVTFDAINNHVRMRAWCADSHLLVDCAGETIRSTCNTLFERLIAVATCSKVIPPSASYMCYRDFLLAHQPPENATPTAAAAAESTPDPPACFDSTGPYHGRRETNSTTTSTIGTSSDSKDK